MGDTDHHTSRTINLSHLTPEEIARRLLETPPLLEQQTKRDAAQRKRRARSSGKVET